MGNSYRVGVFKIKNLVFGLINKATVLASLKQLKI